MLTDLDTLKPIHTFSGIQIAVLKVEFSLDGQFLAATGADNRFLIWNMKDRTVVTSAVQERQYTQFTWLKKIQTQKYPKYTFVASTTSNVYLHTLEFDVGSMKYFSTSENFKLPSAGLNRVYTCNASDEQHKWYFAGSKGGELCIFDIDAKIFKAALQIGNTSMTSLKMVQGFLIAGLNNGHMFKLQGSGTTWNVVGKLELESGVINITTHEATGTIFAGTSDCSIYFIHLKDFKASSFSSAHTGMVKDLDTIGSTKDGMFTSICSEGNVIVWNRKDNRMLNFFVPGGSKKVEGTSVCFGDRNQVISGWKDGAIKCFTWGEGRVVPKLDWENPQAHKGAITTIYVVIFICIKNIG